MNFVREYLVDLNGSAAAIRAGYAPKTARTKASQLMARPDVQDALKVEMSARSARTEIRADSVLEELRRLAFTPITDVINIKKVGRVSRLFVEDTDSLPPDVKACISEISDTSHGFRIRFHDKAKALELLGRHLGLFPNHVELSGKNGGPIVTEAQLSDADLERIAAGK